MFANIANTDLFHFVKSLAAVSFKHFDFELTKTSGMDSGAIGVAEFAIGYLKLYNGWSRMDEHVEKNYRRASSLEAGIKKQNSKKGQEILKLQ